VPAPTGWQNRFRCSIFSPVALGIGSKRLLFNIGQSYVGLYHHSRQGRYHFFGGCTKGVTRRLVALHSGYAGPGWADYLAFPFCSYKISKTNSWFGLQPSVYYQPMLSAKADLPPGKQHCWNNLQHYVRCQRGLQYHRIQIIQKFVFDN